ELGPPPSAAIPDDAWRAAGRALLEADAGGTWGGAWRGNAPAAVRLGHDGEDRRIQLIGSSDAGAEVEGGRAFVDVEGQSEEFVLSAAPTVEEAVRHAAAHAGGAAVLIAP